MVSDYISLVALAGAAAQESAKKMSSQLISMTAPSEWVIAISPKVESIIEKEVLPLVGAIDVDHSKARLVQALGEILGLAYLADYALEAHIGFRIEKASEQVVDIARSLGAQEDYIRAQLVPLRSLYEYESKGRQVRPAAALHRDRYWLKSSDIVFVQLLALHLEGRLIEKPEEEILRCAGAALDVYDDLVDREEDADNVANPFVILKNKSDLPMIALFQEIIRPFTEPLRRFVANGKDNTIRTYCAGVVRRLDMVSGESDAILTSV